MKDKVLFILIVFFLLLFLLAVSSARTLAQNPQPILQAQPLIITPTPAPSASVWGVTKDSASTIQSLVTTAAIILGLITGYYKFIMGRVFVPRVTLAVEGKLFTYQNNPAIWAKMTMKNSGLSRVIIRTLPDEKKTWITRAKVTLTLRAISDQEFRLCPDKAKKPDKWQNEDIFDVFTLHQWVEAGESITDERLILLLNNPNAFAYSLEMLLETYIPRWFAEPKPLDIRTITVMSEGLSKTASQPENETMPGKAS